jgi:hypothetical protein
MIQLFPNKRKRGDVLEETKYDRIPDVDSRPSSSDLENDTTQIDGRRRSAAKRHFSCVKNILLALLAAWGLVDLASIVYSYSTEFRVETATTPVPVSCNCGETIAEAVANGCKYDSIAAAWLPPACRDDELIAEFERAGPNPDGSWPYYADINKTHTLSLEEVAMLPKTGGHFFTTHHWHLVHCAYYWKKMWLAPQRGITIERRYDTLIHINHCQMMFLRRDPLDHIVTEAGVSLHSDRIVIGKKKHQHLQHDDSYNSGMMNEPNTDENSSNDSSTASYGDENEENY